MTKTIATAFLLIAVASSSVWADDPNALLSKDDATQMFALSKAQWAANVEAIKDRRLGDYRVTSSGEYTLYIRSDPASGLLVVTPTYSAGNERQPWKLSVSVIADTPASSLAYRTMTEETIEGVLQRAMREMRPNYSVMGYLVRNKSRPPAMHFSIFRKNAFPPIDALNEMGRVCPTQGGKKTCVRRRMIGSN